MSLLLSQVGTPPAPSVVVALPWPRRNPVQRAPLPVRNRYSTPPAAPTVTFVPSQPRHSPVPRAPIQGRSKFSTAFVVAAAAPTATQAFPWPRNATLRLSPAQAPRRRGSPSFDITGTPVITEVGGQVGIGLGGASTYTDESGATAASLLVGSITYTDLDGSEVTIVAGGAVVAVDATGATAVPTFAGATAATLAGGATLETVSAGSSVTIDASCATLTVAYAGD